MYLTLKKVSPSGVNDIKIPLVQVVDHPHQSLVLLQHGQHPIRVDHIFDADVWIFLMVKKLPVCVDQVSGHPTPEHSHNEGEELGLFETKV